MFMNFSVESIKYEFENVKKTDYFELKIIAANKIRSILNMNKLCRIRAKNIRKLTKYIYKYYKSIIVNFSV